MSGERDSGTQQAAPRNGSAVRDWLVKILAALVVTFLVGAYTMAWAHEGRIKELEIRGEIEFKAIKEDLAEMKADIKTLLRRK